MTEPERRKGRTRRQYWRQWFRAVEALFEFHTRREMWELQASQDDPVALRAREIEYQAMVEHVSPEEAWARINAYLLEHHWYKPARKHVKDEEEGA